MRAVVRDRACGGARPLTLELVLRPALCVLRCMSACVRVRWCAAVCGGGVCPCAVVRDRACGGAQPLTLELVLRSARLEQREAADEVLQRDAARLYVDAVAALLQQQLVLPAGGDVRRYRAQQRRVRLADPRVDGVCRTTTARRQRQWGLDRERVCDPTLKRCYDLDWPIF